MIRINNISHRYGKEPVLNHIDLTIQPGELFAVMGPNGAGKSTLLAAIAGTILPSEGSAEIDGKTRRSSVEDELAIRQQVAYLPADPWVARSIKVRDWLYQYGKLYGITPSRLSEHIDSLLDLFHLTEQADKPINACSTGQQKKTAICGVLVTETPYLVLDEPFTGGLDPSAIHTLERILKHLADREDKTIVIASQIPELVEAIADRVAIIHDQCIAGVGTIDELRAQADSNGPLGAVFEKLAQPQVQDNIERYLQGGA